MDRIGITGIGYQSDKSFIEEQIEHRDARIMDRFSKLALSVARQLFNQVQAGDIQPERLAVVLATGTGARRSVDEFHEIIAEKDYIGINPSKFPNIMLSTALSRITIDLQAKGPSVPIYVGSRDMAKALRYAAIQIKKGRCDAVIILYVNEGSRCFGLLLEKEKTVAQGSRKIRFYVN